jgi:ketosteroid isomerase-like protein
MVSRRRFSLFGLIILSLLLWSTINADAGSRYQRAKDGKTIIWNNDYQAGDDAHWTGDHDADGFANGDGTLTWYNVKRKQETGNLIPTFKDKKLVSFSGTMIRGKFEGVVTTVGSDGQTYRAKYADGQRTGDWKSERAVVTIGTPKGEPVKEKENPQPTKLAEEPPKENIEPDAPAEGPTAVPNERPKPPPVTTKTDNPLNSLMKPPSSLHASNALAAPSHLSIRTPPSPAPASSPISSPPPPPKPPELKTESSPPQPPAPPTTSIENSDDAKAVAALDRQYQAAIKANDAKAIDHILSDGFTLVNQRGQVITKADLVSAAQDKKTIYEHFEQKEGSQNVHVRGDTAVVSETLWIKGMQDGIPIDYEVSSSDTYSRTPSGWRYVYGQSSPATK